MRKKKTESEGGKKLIEKRSNIQRWRIFCTFSRSTVLQTISTCSRTSQSHSYHTKHLHTAHNCARKKSEARRLTVEISSDFILLILSSSLSIVIRARNKDQFMIDIIEMTTRRVRMQTRCTLINAFRAFPLHGTIKKTLTALNHTNFYRKRFGLAGWLGFSSERSIRFAVLSGRI